MATTTNYAWETPDDTDLVKDGAAAIRTLGSSIDTTTKALNPSTTLGDIEYRSSTANTNTRLGIGSTGQVLTVAGGVPSWATPASGSTFSGAACILGTSVTTSNTTWTTITFGSEVFDTDAYHSTSTNTGRFTIPTGKTGYFLFTASATWVGNATGYRQLAFVKNNTLTGTEPNPILPANSNDQTLSASQVLYLSAADYVELQCWQNSGGNLNVRGTDSGNGRTFVSISYLGA